MTSEQKEYLRFTIPQRLEHLILVLSFGGLVVSGLPQKFAGDGWAETLIRVMGGIELVRTIHHVCAAAMALLAIYHVTIVAYKVFVLRVRWTMFPRLDDLLDALDTIRYNLGLTKEHPKLDRYNFVEKAEYWAMVWGTLIMGITGFMLWNPINTARFVAGDLIPTAKAAHGGEAVLAALAIVVWHLYNVHLKTFNKAAFNGKLSERQMEEEHVLELERIRQGRVDARAKPEVIKNRERVFIPVAAICAGVMLVTLYLFLRYEETAITTLPRRARVSAFAPITLTPTPSAPVGTPAPTAAVGVAKPLPASHATYTTCLACHANLPKPALPADHAKYAESTCATCHKVGAAPTLPTAPVTAPTTAPATKPAVTTAPTAAPTPGVAKAQPTDHAGRMVCVACHAALPKPAMPADHAGRTDATCAACHKAAAAPVATTVPTTAPATKPAATTAPTTAPATKPAVTIAPTVAPTPGVAKAQPTDHAGRTVCVACHAALPKPAMPADHAGRTDATCAACHKAAAAPAPTTAPATKPAAVATATPSTGGAGGAKVLPASHAGRTICNACHETGAAGPKNPADHAGRADATCVACHKVP
jgi:cytochrome b subunit of formate dehydrogenase